MNPSQRSPLIKRRFATTGLLPILVLAGLFLRIIFGDDALVIASEPPTTAQPTKDTTGRELASVPKMPVNLSLYLKPHKLNEHGLVMLTDQHWWVSTAYRGKASDGKDIVDERLTLFLSNSDETFSSAIIRLSPESATKLVRQLTEQMDRKVARVKLKDAMTVTLATQPYKLNDNHVVHLAEENLTCEVLQAYVSVDENMQKTTEQRITLVLQDTKNSFWPLIVRMNDAVVRKLIDELQSAVKKSTAATAKPPANAAAYVGTYQDSKGRKLEVKQDGPQLAYAIHWGPNGPVSRGQLVQTAEGALEFRQPGDITPITVKLNEDKKSVTMISLLKLDFLRQ
jgi:hypothetical protein